MIRAVRKTHHCHSLTPKIIFSHFIYKDLFTFKICFYRCWIYQDCEKRTSLPYINASAGHQIVLNPAGLDCTLENDVISCDGRRTFRSARQRWWYMALSRCEPDRVRNDIKVGVDNYYVTNYILKKTLLLWIKFVMQSTPTPSWSLKIKKMWSSTFSKWNRGPLWTHGTPWADEPLS